MLNAMLLVIYLFVFATAILNKGNSVSNNILLTCIISGAVIILFVFVIPILTKKKTFRQIITPDFDRVSRVKTLQYLKILLIGFIITDFVRIDVDIVNQHFEDTLNGMSVYAQSEQDADAIHMLRELKPVIPVSVKDYMSYTFDCNVFTTIVDLAGGDSGASERVNELSVQRDKAEKHMFYMLGYIMIYCFVDGIREAKIKTEDKKKNDPDELKRDIFEGVHLRGD